MTIYEDEETTIDRFYKGLNEEIVDMLADRKDLWPCEDLEEMVHVAMKIERQLQRRSSRYTKSKSSINANTLVEKVSLKRSLLMLYLCIPKDQRQAPDHWSKHAFLMLYLCMIMMFCLVSHWIARNHMIVILLLLLNHLFLEKYVLVVVG